MLARLLVLIALLATPTVSAASLRDDIRGWRQAHEREIVARMEALAAIPSIAADRAGLDRAAATLADELRRRGFEVRLLEGSPGTAKAVFGSLDTPGAR
jgi:acetylornithine deacetylase/succinyl-diaminopimelate desuccinylase-like protein